MMDSKSNYHWICIRDAPASWNSGVVQGMFSQYGPIEDISIQPNPHPSETFFIKIEFESSEDAEAAVEDYENSQYRVTFYRDDGDESGIVSSRSMMVITSAATKEQDVRGGSHFVQAIHCQNTNCSNQVVVQGALDETPMMGSKQGQGIYCSHECYAEFLDMNGRVNIYDKWIASLGRSGTGMLNDPSIKLDKVLITVDSDGVRRIDLN